jgi:hypothetical protein
MPQGQIVQRKVLPKSLSASVRKVFTSRNFRFLCPPDYTPPVEIAVTPEVTREGEAEGSTRNSDHLRMNGKHAHTPKDADGTA